MDDTALIDSYTPVVFVFVLGLSFLILLLVFRCIVVPIKAIVMNLLSVGAAYGLLVLVFQHGVGNDSSASSRSRRSRPGCRCSSSAILFGLSMDYHVFLLSRIREHYDHTDDNTRRRSPRRRAPRPA